VEDRIQPTDDGGLVRRFILRIREGSPDVADQLYIRPHFGSALMFEQAGEYSNNDGLTVSVSLQSGSAGELRNNQAGTEWLIPLEVKSKTQVEVKYSW
jgi:hypothetical protein